MNTITMTIKNGQAEFTNLPEGWGVHVKNYDTNIAEDAFITVEQQEAEQLGQDEGGWYHSAYFADTTNMELGGEQFELPLEG